MTHSELEKYIFEQFGVKPDCPWDDTPNTKVFRHKENRKWFALLMDISARKLGLDDDNIIYVVNLKCDEMMLGSILKENGFYPAYHMNKSKWLTAVLDGSADDDTLRMLINQSFSLTAPKPKKQKVNIDKVIKRVTTYEKIFDELCVAVKENPQSITSDNRILKKYQKLISYYDSTQWRKDIELDEKGMLPKDLKRGILSEDGIYNLISDIQNNMDK